MNNLSNGVSSSCELSSNDTSLFSVVNDIQSSAATLRNDLTVISNRAFQWKMIFNSDLTNQAQKVTLSREIRKLSHPSLSFNNIPIKNIMFPKHLGLTLDVNLNLFKYIKNITQKCSKAIGLLHIFQANLPRSSLLTIHKTFIRSQLEYVDVIYQAYKLFFHEKLESLPCNACLEITGAIRQTSSEKHHKLRLESLKSRS